LVLLLLWGVPALRPTWSNPDVASEHGQVQTFRTSLATPGRVSGWTWNATIDVPGDPRSFLVDPRIAVSIREVGSPASQGASAVVHLRILVNDEVVQEGDVRSTQVPLASVTFPGMPIDQAKLRQGANRVQIQAEAFVDRGAAPSTTVEGSVGPLHIDRVALDGDHDGVLDVYQLFELHSGLAALVVAVPVALIAGLVGRRRA
jgi:hypothetical protein